ncbi:MAG: DUF983 domain-containing protein [Anaerolineae bacterium]|nr:DUF983 domain-containing protein [Anaerolineae bacterium]
MNLSSNPPLSYVLRRALRLRCPACGYGHIYERNLHLHETCEYCHARYEREPGESLGAAYLVSGLTMIWILGGFWALDTLLDVSPTPFLALWTGIMIVLNLFFYRVARALWIAFAYLTGGVYPDPDYEREYVSPGEKAPHYER